MPDQPTSQRNTPSGQPVWLRDRMKATIAEARERPWARPAPKLVKQDHTQRPRPS
jgi:hypothetical protein